MKLAEKSLVWVLAVGLLATACRKEASPGTAAPATAPSAPTPVPATPTPAALPAKASDADRYFKVIEPHLERVNIYDGPELFLRELDKTPERARHLLTAHWCVSEISNGGFQQFFAGAAGVMGPESVAGLRALGLEDNAALVEQAMGMLGAKYPREMGKRNQVLKTLVKGKGKDSKASAEAGPGPFTALDEKFLQALQARPGGFDAAAAAYADAGG